eukprot:scaffold2939_cov406-Prasinococcus_capsulatus_cf.AAC.15
MLRDASLDLAVCIDRRCRIMAGLRCTFGVKTVFGPSSRHGNPVTGTPTSGAGLFRHRWVQ